MDFAKPAVQQDLPSDLMFASAVWRMIKEEYLPEKYAAQIIYDLAHFGLIKGYGRPSKRLRLIEPPKHLRFPEPVLAENDGLVLAEQAEPSGAALEAITSDFWSTAKEGYQEMFISTNTFNIDADSFIWDDDKPSSEIRSFVGQVREYKDVCFSRADVEGALTNSAISCRYIEHGSKALIHSSDQPTVNGRPMSEHWPDWVSAVAVLAIQKRINSSSTANSLKKGVEELLKSEGKVGLSATTVETAAQAIAKRLKALGEVS